MEQVEDTAIRDFSSVVLFCWLEPEEQLVITRESSVQIWDVVAGTMLRSFTVAVYISSMVYSQGLNRLAATSILSGSIVIIDPQTGTSLVLPELTGTLACFDFSPTTEELVCGMHGGGLEVFSFSTRSWRHLEYPRTPDFLFSAPNGTVVVGSMDSGIKVLSLDDEHAPSPSLVSGLSVSTLDEGRIIMITPTACHQAHLLERSTLTKLLTISAPETLDNLLTDTLSASLENRMTVYCFQGGLEIHLQLHRFGDRFPKWTRGVDLKPSVIAISPSGALFVTSHSTCIRTWDTGSGQLQAELLTNHFPSEITFDSETRFYSYYHDTSPYRVTYPDHTLSPEHAFSPYQSPSPNSRPLSPYHTPSPQRAPYRFPHDLNFSPEGSTTCTIIGHKRQFWMAESSEKKYEVDSNCEWVVRGSEKIFWIPLGYLSSNPNSHCWAGSNTLVMLGEGEVVRTLTFRL